MNIQILAQRNVMTLRKQNVFSRNVALSISLLI